MQGPVQTRPSLFSKLGRADAISPAGRIVDLDSANILEFDGMQMRK